MIDPTDDQILHILSSDGRASSEDLAKKLNVSPATVRRRIGRLTKEGLLRIVGLVDPVAAGLTVAALIACNVEHEQLNEVVQMLASQREVKWVSATTGRFDVLAFVRFRSNGELLSFIQSKLTRKAGVRDSETFICLREAKGWFASTS